MAAEPSGPAVRRTNGDEQPSTMTSDIPSFGELLLRLRVSAALSQEALAERAGLSVRGISDLERGARRVPHLETVRLLADALALDTADRVALLTAARPEATTNTPSGALADLAPLPAAPTSLIGREREVATALELLCQPETRLVTLTGPGGVGKTRLALELGSHLVDNFSDGVAFIPLAPIRDPALVVPTVAHALGVREAGGRSLIEGLTAALRARHLLLILDNFEHVIDAAPIVADLLGIGSGLELLITSRMALRLQGEHQFPVSPLPLPDSTRLPSQESLATNAAVTLFVRRARQIRPTFALTTKNAAAVAEICRRLDGLPLAIELAAARISHLSANALLERLERRLPLLTGGARDLPQRQRTLRDAIGWSHELLPPEEQGLFRQLSVFVDGFTLDAAEVVTGVGDLSGIGVLDGVASLVGKSLLRAADDAEVEPRFGMLETVREYAREQLEARGEAEAMRRRHAAWCLSFVDPAERREIAVFSAAELIWLNRVDAEHHNLRAALTWADEREEAETLARLVAALARFWRIRGYLREGRQWVDRVLSLGDAIERRTRLRVLHGAGLIAIGLGDYPWAVALGEEGTALAHELADRHGVAYNVHILGGVALDQGQYEHAATLLEEACASFRAVGDEGWRAVALGHLGLAVAEQGDADGAMRLWDEALSYEDNLFATAFALQYSANVLGRRGNSRGAAERYRRSLVLWFTLGDTWYFASCLTGLATVMAVGGWTELAVRLLSESDALREASGAALRPRERAAYEQAIAAARAGLDENVFAAAWAVGRTMTLEESITIAVELASRSERDDSVRPGATAGLTTRELQVLRLVAAGLSDRDIAVTLFLSRRTVTSHLTSILHKLDVASRSAAVAYAVRHGLV